MRWPWSQREPEKREAVPFSDAVTAALAAQAGGTATGDSSAIAALEAAVALYARAFSAATVGPPGVAAVLTPSVRALARLRQLSTNYVDFHFFPRPK